MTKDNAKTLADRYFRDQCRRMGIPVLDDARPAAKKRTHAFKPRKVVVDPALVAKDTEEGTAGDLERELEEGLALERARAADALARLKATGVWIRPRTHEEMIAGLGYVPPAGIGKTSIASGRVSDRTQDAPKMGLDEIWQAGHEMFSRDDVWAAFRDPPDDKKQ